MRVGLVLGAGGVLGGAWLTGGLHALATETGWDPESAEIVVGTSAGSVMGALVTAGVPPWFMVAHSAGERFVGLRDATGQPAAEADRSAGASFRLHPGLPRLGPGSWSLARASLGAGPRRAGLLGAALAPEGLISTAPIQRTVRRVVPHGWVDHPGLWVVACDYATGQRVVFGRTGAPPAELAEAVAASCAIPGFYRPVRIGDHRYVDGGLHSTSNVDLLSGMELDLVIAMNPTSSLYPLHGWNPAERMAAAMRRLSGRRLGSETNGLRAEGTRVVLLQPLERDLRTMGPNLMSNRRRNAVLEMAIDTVGQQLRQPDVRAQLHGLAPGADYKVRRPADPPEAWPALAAAARGDGRRAPFTVRAPAATTRAASR